MTNQKGRYVGFDIDIAIEMAKAMGVKFVPVNAAWDDIIPSLITSKFDIIISGMTFTQERNLIPKCTHKSFKSDKRNAQAVSSPKGENIAEKK